MNKTILAGASIAALTSASPVLAQESINITQDGLDHVVNVDQIEDVLNEITVSQAGSQQTATVSQRTPGGANTAFTTQGDIGGVGINVLNVLQTGSNNLSAIGQNSSDNFAQTSQAGDGNLAFVDQGFAGGTGAGGTANNAFIRQEGNDNDTTVNQNFTVVGTNNDADIFQISDTNVATVDMEGSDNTAFIIQGDLGGAGGNNAAITQTGDNNLLAISQNGTGNQAIGVQTGSNNELFIDQGTNSLTGAGGDNNFASGTQLGSGNTLTINQNALTAGGGNSATITQLGDNLDLVIDQEGSGHSIVLVQDPST